MEPGIVAAYGVETAVEGAVGAGIAVAKSTLPIKARFSRLKHAQDLPRSSHSLSIINGRAYVFGGEVKPREPVDNQMHIYTLRSSDVEETDYEAVAAEPEVADGQVPSPRVGHTAVSVSKRVYIFGGRGGKDMSPLDEHGRLWIFDTQTRKWSHVDPPSATPYPEPRSYHASTATKKGTEKLSTEPLAETDQGILFVHGGCPKSGRLNDLWAFDTSSKAWQRLNDAPGSPRGGPCLTFTQNRLYRFGGFDGKNECGGQLDHLDVASLVAGNSNSTGKWKPQSLGESQWQSAYFEEGSSTPGNRSVAGLQPITTGQGRNYLLLLFGEGSASSKGHEGAGKFWDDVWCYQLEADAMTGASFKDTARKLVGAKTNVGSWSRVDIPETTLEEGVLDRPSSRGWFASSQMDTDLASIVLWGGINEENERLGDGWILTVNT